MHITEGTAVSTDTVPSKWHQNVLGEGSSIKFDEFGCATITSPQGEVAYLYLPVVVGSGESVQVHVNAKVTHGRGVIHTNELGFNGAESNTLYFNNKSMRTLVLEHTLKLYNTPQILYIKVGSDSSSSGTVLVHSVVVRRTNSSLGSLRSLAHGYIRLGGGSVWVHDRFSRVGIDSVSVTPDSVNVVLSNNYVIASSDFHKGVIPFISVVDSSSTSLVYPKVTNYDQYTRTVTIKFINFNDGSIARTSSLDTAFVFKAEVQ